MATRAPTSLSCPACGQAVRPTDAECPACGVPQGTERTTVRRSISTEPAAAPAATPLLDGKWRLEKKLGKGGMGTVWLAHDVELDRPVAIKMLAENLCDDAELVQRFEREARMMAKLDHPNLVPVYAVGREGNVPYIVMKMLEGSTLGDYLKDRGRLELSEIVAITRQICAGLAFVHQRGVVHRDIKPANVFVAPDGHVTLLDLGVARDATSNMTRSGVVVGTPRYMAPEQILGKRVDHRADLYALSTLLYEMLTGHPVFEADSDFSVMKMHIDEQPRDPAELAQLPELVGAALLKGLAKNPDDRFQSAAELLAALESEPAVANPRALEPLPAGGPPRAGATPRPSKVGAAATRDGRAVATPRPRTPAPAGKTPAPSRRDQFSPGGTAIQAQLPVSVEPEGPRRSRTFLWLAVGGAVALAGVVVVALAVAARSPGNPPANPKPFEEIAIVTPPPPQKEVEAKPAVAEPKAVVPEPKAPEPKAPEPKAPEPKAPEPKAVEPKPAEPKAAPVAAKTGPASVRCTATADGELSWAYIDVDGMRQGATPLTVKLEPGKHVLTFRREGYAPQTKEVEVSAGETKKLQVELSH